MNGLPLVLLELKNPADEHADIWKGFDQIQTYKAQIPEVFQYNELLVIADGSEARLGSLSASAERFMQWRTIDGVTLDPLGQFNELETLVRGLLAPAMLLDYLRFFVLFEEDGTLVKKVAGYHQFHAVRAAIQQVVAASQPSADSKIRHKGGGGLAHPGQRQEHHHDLLCRAGDAGNGDGQPDHCGDYRPQRSGWAVVRGVFPGAGFVARAAGTGHHPSGFARQAGNAPFRRDHLCHHPEVHAGRG